ncbi:MAG: D-glycero-alpha-D-manno-heptose-1,7-bisphosphate 7-phosphatase [Longimicrobiales bacterium]
MPSAEATSSSPAPRAPAPRGRPAAFLDRDGTIVVDVGYPDDPAGVEPIAGAAAALRRLADAGYALVLVTNQSGIARGLVTKSAYEAVQARLEALLAAEGVRLDAALYCPHHPDFTGPCACRKPGTLLHRRAARALGLDLARSVCIGDRPSDVLPALELGGRGYLVRTGVEFDEADVPARVIVCDDVAAAVEAALDES